MPVYRYKAKKGPTEVVTGQYEAPSEERVVTYLDAQGLIPVSVEPIAGAETPRQSSDRERDGEAGGGRVGTRDIDAFTWQLASLTRANVPMLRALTLIGRQTEHEAMRRVVREMEQGVRDGQMLSEVMKRYPRLFNNMFLSMVRAGEKGGTLDRALYTLAAYREKEQAIRRKVQAALAYPLVMLTMGMGTVFVMLTFFMPKFIVIFARLKRDLPWPTKVLIGTSQVLTRYWYWPALFLLLLLALFGRSSRKGKWKFAWDALKLRVPVVKRFVRDAEVSRFCRALGMLLRNGLPIHEGLTLARLTMDNEALRARLRGSGEAIVRKGASLSSSLEAGGVFPPFAINMISVGEEGGKLEEALEGVAETYEREVEQAVTLMTSLLEPLLILLIGGVVGFIVFAMMLPVFDINTMTY